MIGEMSPSRGSQSGDAVAPRHPLPQAHGGEAVQVHLGRLQLRRGDAGQPGHPLPQAHRGEAVQVHLARLQLCRIEAAGRESAQC